MKTSNILLSVILPNLVHEEATLNDFLNDNFVTDVVLSGAEKEAVSSLAVGAKCFVGGFSVVRVK